MTKHIATFVTLVAFLPLVAFAAARENQKSQDKQGQGQQAQHVMLTEQDMTWQEGPLSLPRGAQAAVLEGDPTKTGLFTMRLRVPAGYRIPAHWHPADEHVTVISGTFSMGMGDKLDQTAGKDFPQGSFVMMPAGSRHFAWSAQGATIQLHGQGPWAINYVNPADDPRRQKASK